MCWRNRKRAVVDAGQARAEAAVEAQLSRTPCGSRSSTFFHSTPKGGLASSSRRSGPVAVLGEAVADDDVRGVLALDHHVGAADRVRLVVELLAEHLESGRRVQLV